MTPGEQRMLSSVQAELARLVRYDDESLVHDVWIRQRYNGGYAATYAPARKQAVVTAWHEAGHAVAALAVGARFSSASIRAGGRSSGRVHSITGGGPDGFVIAAAGQVAEGLRGWTLPSTDAELRAWPTPLAASLACRGRRRPPLPGGPGRHSVRGQRGGRLPALRRAPHPAAAAGQGARAGTAGLASVPALRGCGHAGRLRPGRELADEGG